MNHILRYRHPKSPSLLGGLMGSYTWGYRGLGLLLGVSPRVLYGLRSRVNISGVISPHIWVVTIVISLRTLLIATQ